MSGIKARVAGRFRSSSLSAVPPPRQSSEYSVDLAKAAGSILFRSPLPSKEGRPVFILNAAALPDSNEADYDSLLPYVLARLPEEDDLLKGFEYEVVFFAGDGDGSATSKKRMPGWGWFLQAYHVLSRAMRKRLQRLYIVHEKAWVRILTEIFSTIVSPKFRRKIYHITNLTNLATYIPIENLLIPPSTYLTDRRTSDDIFVPDASGRKAFAARRPFPTSSNGKTRFPRVLRETTSFLLMEKNVTSEGLFRIPPHSKLRDVLKEAYDRGQKYIVWKDNETTLPTPPYPQAEHQDEILAEVHPTDAYSVFMAAALIKAWYASLRHPIFPHESYRDLKRLYGDHEDVPTLERLTDLFSPTSEWSFLPSMSREILVRHLLPLLSEVAAHQERNKMTAENLAVCFAPALLCGPDQIEDAKMSSIIRRIFTQAIDLWPHGLREACGQQADVFWEELKLPADRNDWDDPVESKKVSTDDSLDEQMSGITLHDNEKLPEAYPEPVDNSSSHVPPPLPRRPAGHSVKGSEDLTKRKPAPPLQGPPRYSTALSDASDGAAASPVTHAATVDGFLPRRTDNPAPPLPTRPAQAPDEKKSGMSDPVPIIASKPASWGAKDEKSSAAPQIILPKRKALTAAQIDNAEKSTVTTDATGMIPGSGTSRPYQPQGGMALPGLANLHISTGENARWRPTPPSTSYAQNETTSPISAVSASSSDFNSPPPATGFRRPSTPASASVNRTPTITSLARPVYPPASIHPVTTRVQSKATSLPVPPPKPTRNLSPGLLRRMPSFETSAKEAPPRTERLAPKKLNLKKNSVDDLRRLYEERAGTAEVLVKLGNSEGR
ncbi:hypothetical protein P153DRAFT_358858 [Dothidotthia symphoricarpi CBS 119687]|uniref:Rho GTPase activation protein n=1 Tax=Dothidotthia symphoricarpi CBS 119687 TaxID=1392245 RepID=A0A6A6A5Y8_9PLEO|nr:uncharacterized protein P153DRAFT_358858 [Dothidotthia symphoricarpi CBS 119687]KAF2127240.1 hypothetical protein P153DRAFT_358858 [Dothidotthia symphoricarpi CBS 119687]